MRDAMRAGLLGCMTTPVQGNVIPEAAWWAADSGVYGKGFPGERAWFAWLIRQAERYDPARCLFAVAPDVVGDAAATLERSAPWLPKIRDLGLPAAFVAQDGLEHLDVPWDAFDVLFVGGSTAWKLSPAARGIVEEARRRGKRTHMGRVNSWRRWQVADAWGCDSADGTFLVYAPNALLKTVLAWSGQTALW